MTIANKRGRFEIMLVYFIIFLFIAIYAKTGLEEIPKPCLILVAVP